MKQPWPQVEQDLLENVFYAYEPGDVRAASDLSRAGMLDSLSVVAILETLIEATGEEEALERAQAADFCNLEQIRSLYDRV